MDRHRTILRKGRYLLRLLLINLRKEFH